MDAVKNALKGKRTSTGVSDELYDIMVTLTNKLQELWRVDEFIQDESHGRDRAIWEAIREHGKQDVAALLEELRREMNQGAH